MDQVMTIEEIENQFTDEWILVVDPDLDDQLKVQSGSVVWHSQSRNEVYRKAKEMRPKNFALLFTGKIPHDMEIVL